MPHAKRSRHFAFVLTTAALAQLAIWCTPAAAAQQVSFSLDVLPILESHKRISDEMKSGFNACVDALTQHPSIQVQTRQALRAPEPLR